MLCYGKKHDSSSKEMRDLLIHAKRDSNQNPANLQAQLKI